MIDISKQTVNLNCPECKRALSVTIRQVAAEAKIKCTCGQEIQLKDSNGSNRKDIYDINKSFQDFENTLKKIGR